MVKLRELMGQTSTQNNVSSEEVTLLKAKVTSLETTNNEISLRLKSLEDKPAFNPKSIEDAILTLVEDDKVDDAAVAALDKALKSLPTIDLSPYAKTADIKVFDDTTINANLSDLLNRIDLVERDLKAVKPFDDKPILDAIKQLQNEATGYALAADLANEIARRNKIKDIRVSSTFPDPTLEWYLWIQVVEDWTNSTIEVTMFARTGKASIMPMIQRKLTLVPSAHLNAIASPDGTFENGLPRGVSINYKTELDNQNTGTFSVSFERGTLVSYQYECLDANDLAIQTGNGNFTIDDTFVTVSPFYGDGSIVKTKWIFTYSDGQRFSYTVPVKR